jgi:acetyl-CoA synthetase
MNDPKQKALAQALVECPPLPPGYRVYLPQVNIFTEAVERHAAENPSRPAMVWDGGAYSYADLKATVDRAAAGFSELGLKRGDALLLRSPNLPTYCVSALAAMKLGAVAVMTNSLLKEDDLAFILGNSDAHIAAAPASLADPLRRLVAAGKLEKLVLLDDGPPHGDTEITFSDLVSRQTDIPPTADTAALDPAFMAYSSGTTGRPKGILHAHRWVITLGDVLKFQMDYAPGDIVMAPGEFSFMGTFGQGFVAALYSGITMALYSKRATPRDVLEAVSRHRVTKFFSVPTLYRRILAEPGCADGIDLSSVKFFVSSGEFMGATVAEQWSERFPFPILEVYGVGEVQTVIGNTPYWPVKAGSIGKGLPGIRLDLLDGMLEPVAPGQPGRLMIHRSDPGFFLRYHKQWDKWRAAHKGEWYDTGDVMIQDEDGYFYYQGRNDDLFKSRGYFISPQEIENALVKHSAVAEAAVIGIPDDHLGNRIAAYVVLVPNAAGTEDLRLALIEHARTTLAPFKVPKTIEFVPEVPKNAVGKTLRRALV